MCNWGRQVVKFALILEAKVYSILLVEVEVSPLTLKRKGWDLVLQVKSSQANYDLRAILQESEAKLEMKNFNPPSFFVWR